MTDWSKLKVVDLKAELKKRGLGQSGLKEALIQRLIDDEGKEGSESEATIQGDVGKNDASSAASPDTISPIPVPASGHSLEPLSDAIVDSDLQAAQIGGDNTPEMSITTTQADTVQIDSIDSRSPSTQQPDVHKSALPSVEPQEALEDRQKRKRRSQSPPISATDAARKRLRQEDEPRAIQEEQVATANEVTLPKKHEDEQAGAYGATKAVPEGETPAITSTEDVLMEEAPAEGSVPEPVDLDTKLDTESPSQARTKYKDLFSPEKSAKATTVPRPQSRDSQYDAIDANPERAISPAIHPATAALYIRDFMRPLNSLQLKSHLTSLATPPGNEPDPNIISNFYVDPIRTHAFVAFANTSAASRVRNELHGMTWPEEKTRKPLWIDFVPVDKVDEWISREQATNTGGRSSQGKKWEVTYHMDDERYMVASLQEANSGPPPNQHVRQSSTSAHLPLAPAPIVDVPRIPTGPRVHSSNPQRAATNFQKLDDLFKSTRAKPVLYFQPVEKRVAEARLDNIEKALSKDGAAGRVIGGEINRYTFEDGDVLVDRGPEIFAGIRPPRGFRGPRYPGPPRGGYRGGAGGSRSGYDSYRGARRDSRY